MSYVVHKKLGYAKYSAYTDTVWVITKDNEDGTVDLMVDDVQGDIALYFVNKRDITLVDELEYLNRISELSK